LVRRSTGFHNGNLLGGDWNHGIWMTFQDLGMIILTDSYFSEGYTTNQYGKKSYDQTVNSQFDPEHDQFYSGN